MAAPNYKELEDAFKECINKDNLFECLKTNAKYKKIYKQISSGKSEHSINNGKKLKIKFEDTASTSDKKEDLVYKSILYLLITKGGEIKEENVNDILTKVGLDSDNDLKGKVFETFNLPLPTPAAVAIPVPLPKPAAGSKALPPKAGLGALPTAGSKPLTGSTPPPAGSKTPPAGSKTPQVDSTPPPAGLKTPPAGLKPTPADLKTPPAGLKTPPASSTPPQVSPEPQKETEVNYIDLINFKTDIEDLISILKEYKGLNDMKDSPQFDNLIEYYIKYYLDVKRTTNNFNYYIQKIFEFITKQKKRLYTNLITTLNPLKDIYELYSSASLFKTKDQKTQYIKKTLNNIFENVTVQKLTSIIEYLEYFKENKIIGLNYTRELGQTKTTIPTSTRIPSLKIKGGNVNIGDYVECIYNTTHITEPRLDGSGFITAIYNRNKAYYIRFKDNTDERKVFRAEHCEKINPSQNLLYDNIILIINKINDFVELNKIEDFQITTPSQKHKDMLNKYFTDLVIEGIYKKQKPSIKNNLEYIYNYENENKLLFLNNNKLREIIFIFYEYILFCNKYYTILTANNYLDLYNHIYNIIIIKIFLLLDNFKVANNKYDIFNKPNISIIGNNNLIYINNIFKYFFEICNFYFLQDLYFEKYFDYINKPIDTNNDLYKISVEYFNLYLYIYELIALNNDKKITNGKNELINNKGKIIDYINYSKDIYKLIEKIKKYNNIFKDAFRALYDLTENYYYFEKYIYNNRTTLTTTIADLTKYENIKPIIYNIIKIREGFLKTLFKYADKYHEDQDNNKYLTLFKLPGT